MRPFPRLLAAVALASCTGSPGAPARVDPHADGGTENAQVAAPRPIAPVSVSFLTSRRPTFRWQLPSAADGARVEVCADRACSRIPVSFDAAGLSGAPPSDLPVGVVFWRLHGIAAGAVGMATSAPWEMVVPAQSAPVSTAWGAMLDANGDGFGDVAVGDSDTFTATQHVYVHVGSPYGPSRMPSSVLSAASPVVAYAAAIASAGDVDGDGFADFLVGSPHEDVVYVYRGGPSGYADPPAKVISGPAGSSFGAAVSGAGDVDGDGYADVVVGLPRRPPPSGSQVEGAAFLYYGGPGSAALVRSVELGPRAGSDAQGFGTFVSTAGDVDGDGLADVAVWGGIESTDPQYVLFYDGRAVPFGAEPSALLQYDGASPSWLGLANLLTCAGDTNGDGYGDIAISSPVPPTLSYEVDHFSVFFGGVSGPALVPSRSVASPLGATDHFGLSMVALDADQDGLDDLVTSTASYASAPVAALLYRGQPAGPELATVMTTHDPTTLFERELGSPGDIDGDGFPDLLVAFPSRVTEEGAAAGADGGEDAAGGSSARHGAVEVHPGGPQGVGLAARWTLLPPDSTAVAYGASLARP